MKYNYKLIILLGLTFCFSTNKWIDLKANNNTEPIRLENSDIFNTTLTFAIDGF